MRNLPYILLAILAPYAIVITLYAMVITYGFLLHTFYFAHAHTKIRIFEDMENRAIENPQKAKDYAEYIRDYYPAGTIFAGHSWWYPGNLQCEWIVEKSRKETLDRMKARHLLE